MQLINDLSRILVEEATIRERIAAMGRDIRDAFAEAQCEEVTAVCVTNGSIIFAADLLRAVDMHVRVDCIRVTSYKDEMEPLSEPEIVDNIRLDITGTNVLLIDDVLDTGRTLNRIQNILLSMGPRLLKTCVLLAKPCCRDLDMKVDFTVCDIPIEFVVGYGLDFAERYRNLPCIGVLKPHLQNPPIWQSA